MVSPGCASGSFQAGQGQYDGDEGGVKTAQLGVAIDAARIANLNMRRIRFSPLVLRTCVHVYGGNACVRRCGIEVISDVKVVRGGVRGSRRPATTGREIN